MPSTIAALAVLPPALVFGVGVGIVGGIVGLPALPFMDGKKYLNNFIVMPSFISAHLLSIPISHAVGLPFYVIKKTFYDFPKKFYESNIDQLEPKTLKISQCQ